MTPDPWPMTKHLVFPKMLIKTAGYVSCSRRGPRKPFRHYYCFKTWQRLMRGQEHARSKESCSNKTVALCRCRLDIASFRHLYSLVRNACTRERVCIGSAEDSCNGAPGLSGCARLSWPSRFRGNRKLPDARVSVESTRSARYHSGAAPGW